MIYRIASDWSVSAAQLEERLQAEAFVACGPTQEKALGWVPPRGVEHGPLLEVVAGQWLMRLLVETRVLPATVVRRHAQERMEQIEASTGRKPGKKEARDIRDDARLALLPQAFTKQTAVMVWVDPGARTLVLDAGSQARADEVMTALVKAVDGLAVQLIQTHMSPAAAMAGWLSEKEAPAGFSIDQECELKAADESRAVVRYTRHRLDTDEVSEHIRLGKMPTRLALTWNDHVSFVLTESLQLKKVSVHDVVFETAATLHSDGADDHFDADVAIATGELEKLIPDLLEALGGEQAQSPTTA